MKKHILFSIVSLVLVSAVLFSLVPPVHASSSPSFSFDAVPFLEWLEDHVNILENQFCNRVLGKDVCEFSPQKGGPHNFVEQRTEVNGKFGNYYICEYCGKSAGEVWPDAYNSYASGVQDQLGTMIVGNDVLYFPLVVSSISGSASIHLSISEQSTVGAKFNVIFLCDYSDQRIYLNFSERYFTCPVDGFYSLVLLDSSIPLLYSSTSVFSASPYYSSLLENKSYVKGSQIHLFSNSYSVQLRNLPSSSSFQSVSGSFYIRCVPYNFSSDVTQNIGGIDSRAGSLHGDYGIIGDGGTINHVQNDYIFDETTNTYYNPNTNTSTTVTDWLYDYSTRSYTLTLDTGDTVTVTYGDENITVNQGGDTYNVYYIIDGTGGGEDPSPSPSTHRHHYTSEVTKEPTCTLTGTRTYTCEECGHTYTETIPANGHKWEVKTSVQTEYGEDGSLITEGYTIYKCSVCGEEYKDSDGNGPPGGGSGSGGQADGLFKGIFGIFWDFCSFMLDLFNDFVIDGITGFLDMISDGASGFFDILNPVGWFT